MFIEIAKFELRYQLRNPIFCIAVILFALLVFKASTGPNSIGMGPGVHRNAPYKIAQLYLMLSVLYMFVSAAFVSNVIVRDDQTGFGPIVRATRITKSQYLFGRYLGAFLAAALGFLAIPAALWLATLMPWLDPTRLEPNRLPAYLMPYLCIALPNLFLTSALLFSLATMTRSMMATYLGVVGFLMLWAAGVALTGGQGALAAYVDPLGFSAVAHMTRYWTPVELNTSSMPIYGALLWNRIIWIAIGAAFLGLAYARFRFSTGAFRSARGCKA